MNLTPRGCSNIGGGLALAMEKSRSEAMKFFCSYGYAPFNPAEFQLLEGTLKNLPKRRRERIIALNTPYGEPCCLRADITLSALSYMAGHHAPEDFPLRLCYAERIFSSPKPPKENLEDTQIGVELLGWEGIGSDAEILVVLLKALDRLGLDRSVVVLGDASILPALFSCIPPVSAGFLIEMLQNGEYYDYSRAVENIDTIDSADKKILAELPWLKGGSEILNGATYDLFAGRTSLAPLIHLTELLGLMGYEDRIRVDLGFIRDLDYYNGPIFNIYSSHEGELLGGGGRYRGTVTEADFSCQASGFALSLRELAAARGFDKINSGVLIWAGGANEIETMDLASRFADAGRPFEISWSEDAAEAKRLAVSRRCKWLMDMPGKYAEEMATGSRINMVSFLEGEA